MYITLLLTTTADNKTSSDSNTFAYSISTLGFSVPRAGRASEYVQIHCVSLTPPF